MLVKQGDRTYLDAPATAEAAADVIWRDYYTRLPQIRLTGSSTDRPMQSETPIEITLDGNDVARLVECAVAHPTPNMRYGVLAAIWNHAESFRQIFRFGLDVPDGFPEIRKIVADELDKRSHASEFPASNRVEPGVEPLLPRMPLPAHLRDREKQ
jgi:hypothetical protein